MDKLFLIIKSARPGQWVKNIILFAPIVFSGFLFKAGMFGAVIYAFGLFCAISSAIYLLNDILDLTKDREHPFKKNRPIASGRLAIQDAIVVFITISAGVLILSWYKNQFFFLAISAYFLLNILYSFWLKKIPILDVFSIAAGFVLRVYAGAFVINAHMDVWFLLTVVSASLFLAVGKRRSEMTLLSNLGTTMKKHRDTLVNYTPDLLDAYTSMFANTTWLTYALFSFLHPTFQPEGKVLTLFSLLPRTLVVDKWLMATVPIVIFGVMRYMQIIYEKNEGESPHKVLFSDTTLLVTVGLWGIMVISILYFL